MLAPMSVFCATTRFFRNLPKLGRITRNRLNATLSLLYHLHRYRTSKTSAIGSAIVRPYLALSRFEMRVGALNRLVLNHFRGSTAR